MATTPWQKRIERAHTLGRQHAFAAEILGFYVRLALFQEELYSRLAALPAERNEASALFAPTVESETLASFREFLSLVEQSGPERLTGLARSLASDHSSWETLLRACWSGPQTSPALPEQLLGRAFLQPYAEFQRARISPPQNGYSAPLCPFCGRKPGTGIFRQQGEGAVRSLLCFFCLAEWTFRRIVCPACGEEDSRKLPVYSAEEFDYVRVECCDTCKVYIKAIDLTRNGLAEPVVDEIASVPLDLWAHEHGYSKIQVNILGM